MNRAYRCLGMLIGGRQQLQQSCAEQELWLRNWTPPNGVDLRVRLRSLLPTIEVRIQAKSFLKKVAWLGVVQEEAADVAA